MNLYFNKKYPTEHVAVKVLRIDVKKNRKCMQKFSLELVLLKLLRKHENIVHYLGKTSVGSNELRIFMEYADGGELFDVIGELIERRV